MKILAIETSCDETAISIVEATGDLPLPRFNVLGDSLLSQIHIHKEFGGVYPMLAKREHIKNLPILLEKTLEQAKSSKLTPNSLDLIAVTAGPGLEPALWAGIVFAQELGKKWNKPVFPVNHMSGHLFSFLFGATKPIEFPAIALLVSGGHTELVAVEGFDNYQIIGQTRDDAVGEAFDKTARLLGLPYPGGPKISELAEISRARGEARFRFPSPMLNTDDYNFSYSGLKTSVLYKTRELGELDMETKEDLARAFEEAAMEPLVQKTRRALENYSAKTLILGGGVSGNKYLRERLSELCTTLAVDLQLPPAKLTTDNALMIAVAAYVGQITGKAQASDDIKAEGKLKL